MKPLAKKGTGKGPYLHNSPWLDEPSESNGLAACLFFGCQLNTWFLFPTRRNGRERSTPKDTYDDDNDNNEEEEEEEELDKKRCTPMKRALGPSVLRPGDKFCPTPTATSCRG